MSVREEETKKESRRDNKWKGRERAPFFWPYTTWEKEKTTTKDENYFSSLLSFTVFFPPSLPFRIPFFCFTREKKTRPAPPLVVVHAALVGVRVGGAVVLEDLVRRHRPRGELILGQLEDGAGRRGGERRDLVPGGLDVGLGGLGGLELGGLLEGDADVLGGLFAL